MLCCVLIALLLAPLGLAADCCRPQARGWARAVPYGLAAAGLLAVAGICLLMAWPAPAVFHRICTLGGAALKEFP